MPFRRVPRIWHDADPRCGITAREQLQDGGSLHLFSLTTALIVGIVARASLPAVEPAPPEFSLIMEWTAPGDDGRLGRAQSYDLRYSTGVINEANFQSATVVTGMPVPGASGSHESVVVHNLQPNVTYYFALRTRDDAGNWSQISNVASYPTVPTGVETPASGLAFSLPWPNPARVSMRCALTLPEPGAVEADVFSVSGRHVRSLARGVRPAGRSELVWDLTDESGGRVAAGIYLMRARAGGATWTRRVTVIR